MKYVTAYGIAVVIFLIVDAIWLGIVARGFYASRMGELMLDQPRWGVAAVFYLVYVAGLVYFAIGAGMAQDSVWAASLNGALFGFFCYLTYDATNLAVLRGYDPVVAIVDVVWGTVLSGTVAAATVFAMRSLGLISSSAAG
jgi:uncharacterized membrane protein